MFDTARRIGGYDEFQARMREIERRQVKSGIAVYVLQQAITVFGGVSAIMMIVKLLLHRKYSLGEILTSAGIVALAFGVSAVYRFRKMRQRIASMS